MAVEAELAAHGDEEGLSLVEVQHLKIESHRDV